MKKNFFALALLVSAVATAAVKVDVKARCGNDNTEQTFVLNNDQSHVTFEHNNGMKTTICLAHESTESADMTVIVTKDEKELANTNIKAVYGESVSLVCPAEGVDAEITLVASSLDLITQ